MTVLISLLAWVTIGALIGWLAGACIRFGSGE